MPHDVVTMNSRVKFRNLSDGEVRVRTLVYPAKMTDSNTQLSVMAPVGAALLGLRVGIPFTGNCRAALQTHLEVLELEYQPEAAGDYLL
ncbi:regulator of nucleoside diphosphate kinase [Escherichia coli]|uniref:Regulator of nucleoside diphosphate kinase n=1 Tax=Escherichia coli TaxID=562 RepID=A0A376VZ33_ECOLX|nr:regulator of nucleoside diphosphate kinase [Escherichia coli]